MTDRVATIVDRAPGTFDPDVLTDTSLLCRRPVIGYLDPDETLQYLFVNRKRGLSAYDLKHPDVPDDFTTNGGRDKHPEGGHAATMAVTSDRVLYVIGQSNRDLRFSVPFEEITAVRSETSHGLIKLAVRTSKLKYLFIPQPPDDIDAAVDYVRRRIDSSGHESPPTGTTHKYSVDSDGRGPGSESGSTQEPEPDRTTHRDSSVPRQGSDGRTDAGSDGEAEQSQSADDWDWVDGAPAEPSPAEGDSPGTGRDETGDGESTTGTTFSEEAEPDLDTPPSDPSVRRDASSGNGEADGVESEGEATGDPASEPPSKVLSHVEASQEAFADIRSPYEDPGAAYAAAIEAYSELCRALYALPPNGFDDEETRLASQLAELESLIELLDEYGPTLTAAWELVEDAGDTEPGPTDEAMPDRDTLAGELEDLRSAASTLTVSTDPIESLHERLTDPSEAPDDDGEADPSQRAGAGSDVDIDTSSVDTGDPDRLDGSSSDETASTPSEGSIPEGDGESPTPRDRTTAAPTRPERVAHQVFVTPSADGSLPAATRESLYHVAETLDTFDVRTVNLQYASNVLSTLESQLDELETTEGIETASLEHVRRRVEQQRESVEELLEILIETRPRVRLATGEHTSVPHEELVELRERLSEGLELAGRLHRDPKRFEILLREVDDLLVDAEREANEATETQRDPTDGPPTPDPAPDPGAQADPSTEIRPNDLSEWYDVTRNLSQVVTAVENALEELDAPMRDWCREVKQFTATGRDQHPPYGKLQMKHNPFSMSDYRNVYGNGERTTEFHSIKVEPLTETVRTLLERVSDLPDEEVYLPVAPDSKARLPVIVETPEEFERAVALLDELPTTFDAVSPLKGTDTTVPSSPEGTREPTASGKTSGTESDVSADPTEDGDGSDGERERADAPLTDIGGVTSEVAEALRQAGITTREQLVSTDMDELAEIEGVGKAIAQRIKMQVG